MSDTATISYQENIQACFSHARDLLRAAKRVLSDEKLPNIAFTLATHAIEEIGKASLIGTGEVARSHGGDATFIDNRFDDHIFKLFWALWTPVFGSGNLSREQLEELQGSAKSIYAQRLAALYVSPDQSAAPADAVSEEQATAIISLAEARLGMETSREWMTIDLAPGSDPKWFLEATDDPEMRKLIFGQASLDKLKDFGNQRDWIVWLRREFESADAAAKENLMRELARTGSGTGVQGAVKWKMRVRLQSPAHSVRPKALRTWNERPTWISLSAVQNNKNQLDVEFTFREDVTLADLGMVGYRSARMFATALSIGSGGLWWWSAPDQEGRYYERIVDVQGDEAMRFDVGMHVGPKVEWQRVALNEEILTRVAVCLGMIAKLTTERSKAVIEPYAMGLALMAKHDVHLNLGGSACGRFARSLLEGMRHFGSWDGTEGGIGAAIAASFADVLKTKEDQQEPIELLSRLHKGLADLVGLNLERAAVLKVFCDVYFTRKFYEMASGSASDIVASNRTDGGQHD